MSKPLCAARPDHNRWSLAVMAAAMVLAQPAIAQTDTVGASEGTRAKQPADQGAPSVRYDLTDQWHTIDQIEAAALALAAPARRNGLRNGAVVATEGDDNDARIIQSSGRGLNVAGITQQGDFNDAEVTQRSGGVTVGGANAALVSQTGDFNSARITQETTAARAGAFSNRAVIRQNGSGNIATTQQNGADNTALQEQTGDNNISRIVQTGDGNFAVHRQVGDGLSLTDGIFGAVGIEQTGGASIIIEQYSAGTAPVPPL